MNKLFMIWFNHFSLFNYFFNSLIHLFDRASIRQLLETVSSTEYIEVLFMVTLHFEHQERICQKKFDNCSNSCARSEDPFNKIKKL